jgi:hypothetical protein
MDLWKEIQPLIDTVAKELSPIFSALATFFQKTLAPVIKTLVGVHLKALGAVLGVVFDWVGKLVDFALPPLRAAFEFIAKHVIPPIAKGFEQLWKGAETVGRIFGEVSRGVKRAWDSILGAIKSVINTIIRGWNSLKFSVPSVDLGPLGKIGGFTIGTPNIPYMHKGGIVPGPRGSDQLAILQAGETVLPMRSSGGKEVHIHIGNFVGTGPAIDELAAQIAYRMRTVGA